MSERVTIEKFHKSARVLAAFVEKLTDAGLRVETTDLQDALDIVVETDVDDGGVDIEHANSLRDQAMEHSARLRRDVLAGVRQLTSVAGRAEK